ncbi:MAG: neocarzinostatin apoprotein domain-containing protein [Acidimicrobiales bacterium]
MRTPTNRIRIGTGLAALILLGGGLVGPSSAYGAKVPKLFVSPSSGLKGGETVKVHGTGFKPKDNVYIVQCLSTAKGAGECNTLAAMPVTINAKGGLPLTKFRVVAGPIGNGSCGTTKKNLKSCEISAGNASGGDSSTARIVFKLKK